MVLSPPRLRVAADRLGEVSDRLGDRWVPPEGPPMVPNVIMGITLVGIGIMFVVDIFFEIPRGIRHSPPH